MKQDQHTTDLVLSAIAEGSVATSGWVRSRCPFCLLRKGSEGRFGNFAISPETGYYHCFRCFVKGSLHQLPAGWGEAVSRPKVATPNILDVSQDMRVDLPVGFRPFADPNVWYRAKARPGIEYCLKRGLSPQLILEAGIGYVEESEDFRVLRRVIIPIMDPSSNFPLGWVGRQWTKKSVLPYLYGEGMTRSATIYNGKALLTRDPNLCFIVEGAFDVLALWPHAIAVLGTYSEQQVDMIAQSKRRFVVVLDGDAHNSAMGLAMKLDEAGVPVGCVRLPPKLDPDEVPFEWLTEQGELSVVNGIY